MYAASELFCAIRRDPEKAARNADRHGVTFEEAKELFTSHVDVLEIYDLEHSEHEDRFKSLGPIRRGLILVVWTERTDDVVRIISARFATRTEELMYRNFLDEINGR
jgi:hypothetical protein